MGIGPIPTIEKGFLLHTREWERTGHLGLEQVYVNLIIYEYLSLDQQRVLARINNKNFLFYTTFVPLISNTYISNIPNLYSTEKNLSLAPQTICDHMFSDPKSDHNFHIFGCVPGLYFVSSCMRQLSTYSEDRNVLEYTVSWFPIELNQPKKEYYFLKIQNQIRNTTWRSILKIA